MQSGQPHMPQAADARVFFTRRPYAASSLRAMRCLILSQSEDQSDRHPARSHISYV